MNDLISTLISCKKSSHSLRISSLTSRQNILRTMTTLLDQKRAQLLLENAKDISAATDITPALKDRLLLDDTRIDGIIEGLNSLLALPDTLGTRRPFAEPASGIQVYKQRIPLGVILMIYEARPNVAVDAAALALLTGNAILLRGGKEATYSNRFIGQLWHAALQKNNVNESSVCILTDTGREAMQALLQRDDLIDLVIPRGGEGLIRFVAEHSRIPVIRHYKGVCHLYIDKDADLDMATQLLIDGKCSRPGVCNALETLILHRDIVTSFKVKLEAIANEHEVQLYADENGSRFLANAIVIDEEGYNTEHLSKKLSVKIVDDLASAIAHIANHGSQHTEVICTQNSDTAERFLNAVDASAVMVNASSRFNDGGQLGLGAEIGIATTKLHAYGPMGLESLTAEKYVVLGQGQVRHRR